MIDVKDRVMAIMDTQSKRDGRLRTAWTGDAESIVSVEEKTMRAIELSVEYRKRELRKVLNPASEPWGAESEPKMFDVWEAAPEWMNLGDGDCSEWKNVGEYWEECSECEGRGGDECLECFGTGKCTCRTCGGAGVY